MTLAMNEDGARGNCEIARAEIVRGMRGMKRWNDVSDNLDWHQRGEAAAKVK